MTSLENLVHNEDLKDEISKKIKKIRVLMEEKELNGVLIKRHSNFSWLTAGGLNILSVAQDTGLTNLLITLEKSYVISNNIESPRMEKEERMVERGFEVIDYPWYENKELDIIKEIVGEPEKVGCDICLPPFQNISYEISKLRYQLLETEKQRYLWLGKRLSEVIEKVAINTRPGLYEAEIAAELAKELWNYRIDPIAFQVAADERVYNYRHPIARTNPVHKLLLISVIGRRWGLVSTVTRMVHFGRPSEEYLKQYRDNVRIECEMIALSNPGEKAVTPVKRAVELYEEFGYKNEWEHHHQGGAMGYAPRDYRVDFSCKEVIKENQAFCWNPSIAGSKSEDGFIATNEGPIFITYPTRFPVLKLEVQGREFSRPDLLIL